MPVDSFSAARTRRAIAGFCLVALAAGCERSTPPETAPAEPAPVAAAPEFTGGDVCADCHAEQARRWAGSHHDLAMQPADETTVLGDFDAASFEGKGVTTAFVRRDGEFLVQTSRADGEPGEFKVTYTFGVTPLQQYLVELPGGRLQALTVAWDSRPAAEGGQRWFDLYEQESIDGDDPLHWTSVLHNWNSSCASCHSTNLEKNFAPDTHRFATTYSSVDVDCEACHGPGSLHAADPATHTLALGGDDAVRWEFAPGTPIAHRVPELETREELETCARCHARRSQYSDATAAGDPFLDAYRPALLEEGLYHADGQIDDEVYVYGSFLQSRMHAAGVTCSDCHDPHTAQPLAEGNALCGRCHLASRYDVESHHRHEPDTPGAACVDCHMPAKTYMVVDPRRDHSFRVPRPDLSVRLGTPNACTGCHTEQSDEWAAGTVAGWYPDGRSGEAHFATALAAARSWSRNRGPDLVDLASDDAAPGIARATAVSLLGAQPDEAAMAAIVAALGADEPLMQMAAIDALAGGPESLRLEWLRPLLEHPLRTLRISAARQLATVRMQIPQAERGALETALDEYREAQAYNSDRGEGRLNLAALASDLGDPAQAEAELETAIEQQPWFVAAYVNLADLYRQSGRDGDVVPLLETAVERAPDDPAGHFALGLAEVRAGNEDAAMTALHRALQLAPDEPYYHYVYGIALNSTRGSDAAISALSEAHDRFRGYREITYALATIHRDAGDIEAALGYARDLVDLSGSDPAARALLRELEARGP